MNNLLSGFYNEFVSITYSYCGERTDWKDKHNQLEILLEKINRLEIRESKNSAFYRWVKKELSSKVEAESQRVKRIAAGQGVRQKGGSNRHELH